jgi:hypothetical protein
MIGTDTFTPERWHYIVAHAAIPAAGWPTCRCRGRGHRLAQRRGAAAAAAHQGMMRRGVDPGAGAAGRRRCPGRAATACRRRLRLLARGASRSAAPDRFRAAPGAAAAGPALRAGHRRLPTRPAQPLPVALRVDADMPAHRHGMNYRTTVTALGDGRFRAEGLMFHMAGRWRLLFDLPAPTAAGGG